jgi:hypothetical protein
MECIQISSRNVLVLFTYNQCLTTHMSWSNLVLQEWIIAEFNINDSYEDVWMNLTSHYGQIISLF